MTTSTAERTVLLTDAELVAIEDAAEWCETQADDVDSQPVKPGHATGVANVIANYRAQAATLRGVLARAGVPDGKLPDNTYFATVRKSTP
jgi:hypothetical protein